MIFQQNICAHQSCLHVNAMNPEEIPHEGLLTHLRAFDALDSWHSGGKHYVYMEIA